MSDTSKVLLDVVDVVYSSLIILSVLTTPTTPPQVGPSSAQ